MEVRRTSEAAEPWLSKRRLFILLPCVVFASGLTLFQTLPEEDRRLAWVCSSCAAIREELRVTRLGLPMHWTYDVRGSRVSLWLDPEGTCRHEWRSYRGIGAARLRPYEQTAFQEFVVALMDRGIDIGPLMRWDLRGDIEGAWTRGPFPPIRSKDQFLAWFQTLRASSAR